MKNDFKKFGELYKKEGYEKAMKKYKKYDADYKIYQAKRCVQCKKKTVKTCYRVKVSNTKICKFIYYWINFLSINFIHW